MKLAIFIPGIVPVPAVHGGAIEKLTESLINQNEKIKTFDIDLYTLDCPELQEFNYKKTKLIKINKSKKDIFVDKFINKFYSIFNIEKKHSSYANKAVKLFKNKNYDYVLIENNMYVYKQVYKICENRPNVKFVFHLHNDIDNIDKPKNLCRYISKTAYKVIACSDFIKARFEQVTQCKNVYTLYNVLDFDKVSFNVDDIKKIKETYNLKSDEKIFGFIGRLSPEKGVLELIKAFKMIDNMKAKLLIVGEELGDSYFNSYLKKIKKELGDIKDRVIFAGKIPYNEVFNYINLVDYIVVPTICEEAFGMIALEAIACKKIVIVSKSGGLTEVVGKKYKMIANKDNLVNNLTRLMNDIQKNNENSDIQEYISNRRKECVKIFNYNDYLEKFIKILK